MQNYGGMGNFASTSSNQGDVMAAYRHQMVVDYLKLLMYDIYFK